MKNVKSKKNLAVYYFESFPGLGYAIVSPILLFKKKMNLLRAKVKLNKNYIEKKCYFSII